MSQIVNKGIANTTIDLTAKVTGLLPIANGGTNASSASSARTNLSAAASGANSDITSLSGLTTPLTVVQGGTGLNNITANSVLTGNGTSSVTPLGLGTHYQTLQAGSSTPTYDAVHLDQSAAVTGLLPIANGGTNASSASAARTNLSAAASGANSDITSLTGLTTPLSAAQGGTGLATGTTSGNVLTWNGSAWVAQAPTTGYTPAKQVVALVSGDITNQYYDLSNVAITGSILMQVSGQGAIIEGASYDYSVNYTGGAGGKTRITFLNSLATGGSAALVATDVVSFMYQH